LRPPDRAAALVGVDVESRFALRLARQLLRRLERADHQARHRRRRSRRAHAALSPHSGRDVDHPSTTGRNTTALGNRAASPGLFLKAARREWRVSSLTDMSARGSTSQANEPRVALGVANESSTSNDTATQTSAPSTWSLGVLLRAGEPGASLPLSLTLRAWC